MYYCSRPLFGQTNAKSLVCQYYAQLHHRDSKKPRCVFNSNTTLLEMESFLTPYGLLNSGQGKLQFTPFWGGPMRVCSDGLRAGTIESHNFFVLRPILVKFHIRNYLVESFPTIFRTWWCAEEKLHFTPVHTLRQLKRDEALNPPLWRVLEFRARYG